MCNTLCRPIVLLASNTGGDGVRRDRIPIGSIPDPCPPGFFFVLVFVIIGTNTAPLFARSVYLNV